METRYAAVRRLLNDEKFIKGIGDPSTPKLAKLAGVEYRWLQKIKNGDVRSPDSDLIDVLYFFLVTNKKAA